MTREIAHRKSFEKALYAIEPNFLPGMPEFEEVYVNTSQGEGDMRGPWNSDEHFDCLSTLEEFSAVDGGDGDATVELPGDRAEMVAAMVARRSSDPACDPVTGIDLGRAEGTMAKTTKVASEAGRPRSR